MKYHVTFAPMARVDLTELIEYLEERFGAAPALGFIDRIEEFCLGSARCRNGELRILISGPVCAPLDSNVG